MNDTILSAASGIRTHQFGLDSVANNIANVNTNGYKENIPAFKNLFAMKMDYLNSNTVTNNDKPYGSTKSSNAISTKDGSYKMSDGDFDVGYMGKGWFVVGDNIEGSFKINDDGYEAEHKVFFTRDGAFFRDANGNLVTSNGNYVYGIDLEKINNGVFTANYDDNNDLSALASSTLKPLNIPKELQVHPVLTTAMDISLNLNPKADFSFAQEFITQNGSLNEERILNQDIASFADSDNVAF